MSKVRKKIGRVILIAYLVVFCLPAIFLALLRTPYVQQYIANRLSEYLSEEMNTRVEIGKVDIIFPLDISLRDVYIEDLHGKPLLTAKEIFVSPKHFNFGFSKLDFKKIRVDEAKMHLIHYPNEIDLNLQFLIDYFSGSKKDTKPKESSPTSLQVEMIELRKCSFFMQDLRKDLIAGNNINFNNLLLSNIDLIGQNLFNNDSVTGIDLQHLALYEQSGFHLLHMSSQLSMTKNKIDAKMLKLLTKNSNLNMDFSMRYDSMQAFNSFVDEVFLDAYFKNSKVGLDDIARFVPELNGMRNAVILNGYAGGTIADLQTEQMKLDFGSNSHMYFNLDLKGLPDIEKTEVHFNLVNAKIKLEDIDSFVLPNGNSFNISSIVGPIRQTDLSMRIDGMLNDFTANVTASTNSGFIKAEIESKGNMPNPHYSGKVVVDKFDLNPIFGKTAPVGDLTAVVNFSGQGLSSNNYFIDGDAKILSLVYNKYNYSDINVKGNVKPGVFEGHLLVDDRNISMDFDGMINFSEKLPVFDFIAKVDYIDLSALNFARNDNLAGFSGFIDVNLKGNDPDNMLGRLNFKDLSYYEGSNEINLHSLSLKLEKIDSVNKNIELTSDVANGSIKGQFTFSELDMAFNKYLSNYIPSYIVAENRTKKLSNQIFEYEFNFKNIQPVLDIFANGMQISDNTILRGNFNLEDNFMNTQIASNYLKFGAVKSVNPVIIAQTFGKNIYVTFQSDNLKYNDSLEIGNLIANTVTVNDRSTFSINWHNDNSKKVFSGDLSGNVLFRKGMPVLVQFDQSDLTLNDSLYQIADKGKIEIDTGFIRIHDFELYSKSQSINIDGRISKDPYDIVQITFKNVLLDDFDDLTSSYKVNLDGKINGYVLLSNLYDVPDYRANVMIEKLSINKNHIGNMSLKSSWAPWCNAVYSELAVIYTGNVGQNVPLEIKGFFNAQDKENMLDFAVKLDRFNLKLIQPYISSFSSRIDGSCDGNILIKGNFDKPDISGDIVFRRTSIKVDYLNMFYSFADTLKLSNREFALRNITIFDTKGNKATGNILATHNHFKDFYLDINIKPDKMQFLNTTAKDNDYFYGTAFASGVVKIFGPFDQMSIEVVAKTEPGSVLHIPITSSTEVYENDFITFVSNKDNVDTIRKETKINDSGINLILDIDVTPDAEVQIEFDPKIGDIMKGRGSGRMRLTIDRSGEFLMFGNLEIEKGDYLFTLENIVNKKFLIDRGGVITWNGDPYGGKMDLFARYSIKTSLYELVSVADVSEQYKNKVPVSCMMHLSGDLLSPDISFDIDLPDSDENTKNLVRTVIANAEEMNRQVFALLILNSFIPTERNAFNSPISQGIGNTSVEMLSNQFGNWLSQISSDFDVGFSYNQGDQVTSSQVEIALSTQILNERIVLETNLEIGGNQIGAPENQQASNIAGDVSIEYKISEDGKIRVKAFNRSNTVDVINNNAPYTQGVAVFYRKDFDRFKELWERKKKNKIKK